MKNLFDKQDSKAMIERINQLTPQSNRQWGKMDVAQMMAHCNVAYDMVYDEGKYSKPNGITKFFLKLFVKSAVVGPKPYKRNIRTAPEFLIESDKDFDSEKKQLIGFIEKTQKLGASHFDGKLSRSFGVLSAQEWNVMFSKHLDHHLTQFGV